LKEKGPRLPEFWKRKKLLANQPLLSGKAIRTKLILKGKIVFSFLSKKSPVYEGENCLFWKKAG